MNTRIHEYVYSYNDIIGDRIKLKWFSSYLLNASLKGLDHFILIHTIANKFTVGKTVH